MPKVSIIIPAYNGEQFILDTIESIFNQTYNDLEIIVINDNSTDNTENIILNLLKEDKRIIYIRNIKNINIVGSRNKGLKIAKGDYICFLDQDDLYSDTEKIEKQVDFLENNTEYGMIGTGVVLINENGKEIGKIKPRVGNNNIKNHIIMSNQFSCGSVMFRKYIISKIGYLEKKYEKSDDYDYWLKIGKISKVNNLQDYLFSYRIHGNNTTFRGLNKYIMILTGFKLALIHSKCYPKYIQQIFIRFFGDFIFPKFIYKMIKGKL